MARRKPNQPTGEIKLELGELYPKQWQFIESKTRYTAYGGARGGGKTHVLIRACIRGALQYPGIKILILRRTYPELEQTIIQPMNKLVNSATMDGRPCGDLIATYNGTMRMLLLHLFVGVYPFSPHPLHLLTADGAEGGKGEVKSCNSSFCIFNSISHLV